MFGSSHANDSESGIEALTPTVAKMGALSSIELVRIQGAGLKPRVDL